MSFFEGAVLYSDIKTMPISEVMKLQNEANDIGQEREAELKRSRSGK